VPRGDRATTGAAIVADRIGAVDPNQFCRTRLQPIDQACAVVDISGAAATVLAPT